MKIFYLLFFIFLLTCEARSQGALNPAIDARSIRIYPNPATTQITFSFENGYDKDYSFQIYNFIGKKVYELPALSTIKTVVDLSAFYRGVYIFQVRDKAGRIIESGKFQVSR